MTQDRNFSKTKDSTQFLVFPNLKIVSCPETAGQHHVLSRPMTSLIGLTVRLWPAAVVCWDRHLIKSALSSPQDAIDTEMLGGGPRGLKKLFRGPSPHILFQWPTYGSTKAMALKLSHFYHDANVPKCLLCKEDIVKEKVYVPEHDSVPCSSKADIHVHLHCYLQYAQVCLKKYHLPCPCCDHHTIYVPYIGNTNRHLRVIRCATCRNSVYNGLLFSYPCCDAIVCMKCREKQISGIQLFTKGISCVCPFCKKQTPLYALEKNGTYVNYGNN